MADGWEDSTHHDAQEATLTATEAPSQDAHETVNRDISSPASTGKRPVDHQDHNGEVNQFDEELRPRKKARTILSASVASESKASPSNDDAAVGAEESYHGKGAGPSTQPLNWDAPATGLRTSFEKTSQVTEQNVHLEMHNSLTAAEREQLLAAVLAGESIELEPYANRGLNWTACPIKSEWVTGTTWLEVFKSLVNNWCIHFHNANRENTALVGLRPTLLCNVFMQRMDESLTANLPLVIWHIAKKELSDPEKHMGKFRKNKDPSKCPKVKVTPEAKAEAKAAKKRAKAEAKKLRQQQQQPASQQQQSPKPQQQGADSGPSTSASTPVSDSTPGPSGNNEDTKSHQPCNGVPTEVDSGPQQVREQGFIDSELEDGQIDDMATAGKAPLPSISEAELEQRHHYYPMVADSAVFCLTCAQYDKHPTSSCPENTCKFCQEPHFQYQCPTRSRCTKCKQIGHLSQTCTEKLAVAPGEVVIECAFCQAHDHTEKNCNELWQSYRPRPGKVQKVRSLPVYCYCCGAEGHFGGDCGLADSRIPPTKTWTAATASLYIDSASADDALVYKNPLPLPQGVQRPIIPGRSIKPRTHIVFEESEDDSTHHDATSFIRPAVADGTVGPSGRKQVTGQSGGASGPKIQISSNINFGGNGGNQRQLEMSQPFDVGLPGTKKGRGGGKRRKGNANGVRPPLPPGPPPQQHGTTRGRGSGGSGARGHGGFSSLKSKRGGRGNRGRGSG